MIYEEEIFKEWMKARIKFVSDFPATARALALKTPIIQPGEDHIDSERCWCCPEAAYINPETGATALIHWRAQ